MMFSIVAALAAVPLVFAAPPAAATYCSEDNLLRAFQHTPTPAITYCSTPTGYPTFLAVKDYPSSRLTSACSCFSRIPVELPPTSCYQLNGYSTIHNYYLNIIVTVDNHQACGGTGHVITNICGNSVGSDITFTQGNTAQGADGCFPLDNNGFAYTVNSQHIEYKYYAKTPGSHSAPYEIADVALGDIDSWTVEFVPVSCNTPCPNP